MNNSNVTAFCPRSLSRPVQHDQQVALLDLAALWLSDQGWQAESGVFCDSFARQVPALSTNAPFKQVIEAAQVAQQHLRQFLCEAFEYEDEELPKPVEMQIPTHTRPLSRYAGGLVYTCACPN